MIESISISNVATFGETPVNVVTLSQINFFFGSNGTGKTSVSRVIANETKFPTCNLTWKAGLKLQTLVYNNDFVEKNFNQLTELKGVFTLGEKQLDTLAKIKATKSELDALTNKIATLTLGLQGANGSGGKKGDLATLEAGLKVKCWVQKQKYDAKLGKVFEGYRNNKENFKNKILKELTENKASPLPLAELEKKVKSVFGPTPTEEAPVPFVDAVKLLELESDPILKKVVIGKEDVDIAAMIKKLGSSDWVRAGRTFYEEHERTCPFCQQKTSEKFAQSLNEYFDEKFVADSQAIDNLVTNYATEAKWIQEQLASIIASPSKFLDVEKLEAKKQLLDTKILLNNQHLDGKKKEARRVVELESLSNLNAAIKTLIDEANAQVTAHNKMVDNLATERKTLTAQVWKFIVDELKTDLDDFNKRKDALGKGISGMTENSNDATIKKVMKDAEIREFEKQITSTKPTIDGINSLLSKFGFQGFKLNEAERGSSYKLIRSDGSNAKATLSEGEKTFVTFLYFYHLLKGSESDSGMTTDRIVVFDDPVSSLDSDILFIVSTLIKELFVEVSKGTGRIKQLFLLTHNVYFHKEVTYQKKKADSPKERTYWIVRKPGLVSKIEKYTTNPINTSYELLWAEVCKSDHSNLTIQNTLRRILENYFKILGGIDLNSLYEKFDDVNDKLVCRSLCSWVNDGSHWADDNLYIAISDSVVESYLEVFKKIFEISDHIAHYNMMITKVRKPSMTAPT